MGRKSLSKELVVRASKDYGRGLTLKQIGLKHGVSVGSLYRSLEPVRKESLPAMRELKKIPKAKGSFLSLVWYAHQNFISRKRGERYWVKVMHRDPDTLPLVRHIIRFIGEVKKFKTLRERFHYATNRFPGKISFVMLFAMEEYVKDPNAVVIGKKWDFSQRDIQAIAKLLQVDAGSNWRDYWRSEVLRLHSRYFTSAAVAEKLGISVNRIKTIVQEAGLISGHLRHGLIADRNKEKIIRLHKAGYSLTGIAEVYGISEQALWKRFRIWGVPVIRHQNVLPGVERLKKLLNDISAIEIAKMYGVDPAAVYRKLVAAGIRFYPHRLDYFKEGMSADELRWLYERLIVEQIGNLLSISPSSAYNLLLEKGLQLRSPGRNLIVNNSDVVVDLSKRGYSNIEIARTIPMSEGYVSILLSKAGALARGKTNVTPKLEKEVAKLYNQGLVRKEIADQLFIPRTTVDYLIRKAGIARGERKYSPEEIAKQTDFIKKKLDEGMPVMKIGTKIGLDKETVRARIKDAGFETVTHHYTFGKDRWNKLARRAAFLHLVRNYDNQKIARILGLGGRGQSSAIVDHLLESADDSLKYYITYYKFRNGRYEPVRTGTVSRMNQLLSMKRLLQTGLFADQIKDLRIWVVKK